MEIPEAERVRGADRPEQCRDRAGGTGGIQPSIVQLIETVLGGLKGETLILPVEQYLDFAAAAVGFIALSRGQVVGHGPKDAMSRERLSKFMSV